MPLYESTFIARHDMSTRQVESLAEDLTTIVKDNGGEVAKTEFWGPRTLAYRIKKNRKGHYVFFNLDAPSEAVQEYERNMRLNEDILRYMTVRVDELDPNPSAIMQSRSARDDRSRRGGPGRDHGDAAPGGSDVAKTTDKPAAKAEPTSDDDTAKTPDPATPDAAAAAVEATPTEAGSEAADAAEADATPTEAKSEAADTKKPKAKPKAKAKAKSKAKKSDDDAADDGASADEDGETS